MRPTFVPVDLDRFDQMAEEAQAGSAAALEELTTLAYPFVWRLLASKNWFLPRGFDWDDLQQVGAIGIVKELPRWRPALSAFRHFAWTVAERDIQEVFKYARRPCRWPQQRAISLDSPAYRDKHGTDEGDDRLSTWLLRTGTQMDVDPADAASGQEEHATAVSLKLRLTDGLSDLQRKAVDLYLLRGLTQAKTAAALNRGAKSIDNAVQKALVKVTDRALAIAAGDEFDQMTRKLVQAYVTARLERLVERRYSRRPYRTNSTAGG